MIRKSFAEATMGALNGKSTAERGGFDGYCQGLTLVATLIGFEALYYVRITPFEAVVKVERKTSTFGFLTFLTFRR